MAERREGPKELVGKLFGVTDKGRPLEYGGPVLLPHHHWRLCNILWGGAHTLVSGEGEEARLARCGGRGKQETPGRACRDYRQEKACFTVSQDLPFF